MAAAAATHVGLLPQLAFAHIGGLVCFVCHSPDSFGDHLGVLRFDFGSDDDKLRHVSWEEWFKTFDERGLNFIYQEQRSDGSPSNFFQLENPQREDA